MSGLDELMANLPHLHRIQLQVVGRNSGRRRKYEIKYFDSLYNVSALYTYTADTAAECVNKLKQKLSNPAVRVGCHCCRCHCV